MSQNSFCSSSNKLSYIWENCINSTQQHVHSHWHICVHWGVGVYACMSNTHTSTAIAPNTHLDMGRTYKHISRSNIEEKKRYRKDLVLHSQVPWNKFIIITHCTALHFYCAPYWGTEQDVYVSALYRALDKTLAHERSSSEPCLEYEPTWCFCLYQWLCDWSGCRRFLTFLLLTNTFFTP